MIHKSIFLSAINSASEGITIADASLPDCPILYANYGFYRLTGYTQEETIGRNCRFLQGADTDQPTAIAMGHAIRSKQSYTGEILNYRKNGTSFWNRISISHISDSNTSQEYIIGIQTDITQERELIEQQRNHIGVMRHQADEMTRSLRIISHDIQISMKSLNAAIENGEHDSLQTISRTLNSNITLLATMLETNSHEILQYVTKRRA